MHADVWEGSVYATDFYDIPAALASLPALRARFLRAASSEPMPGKVLEGGHRDTRFRVIIKDFGEGTISLDDAFQTTEASLPRHSSIHAGNNRVFPKGWAERLVRTQISRLYNQCVLEEALGADPRVEVYVPHSSHEDPGSQCSQMLAGSSHSAELLLRRLTSAYRDGVWGREVKVPDHPHCTHVVRPFPDLES